MNRAEHRTILQQACDAAAGTGIVLLVSANIVGFTMQLFWRGEKLAEGVGDTMGAATDVTTQKVIPYYQQEVVPSIQGTPVGEVHNVTVELPNFMKRACTELLGGEEDSESP